MSLQSSEGQIVVVFVTDKEQEKDRKITAIFSVMMQMPMLLNIEDDKVSHLFGPLSEQIVESLTESPDKSVGFDLGETTIYAAQKEDTYKIKLRCEQLQVDGKITLSEDGFNTEVNTRYNV